MRKALERFKTIDVKTAAKRAIAQLLALCLTLTLAGCQRSGADKTSTGSADTSADTLSNQPEDDVIKGLYFSYPKSDKLTVYSEKLEFSGSCSPNETLTLNGRAVTTTKEGYFTVSYTLKKGQNKITFQSGKQQKTFVITYALPLIKSYTPNEKSLSLAEGTVLSVSVTALTGSRVAAVFGNKSVTLSANDESNDDGKSYSVYRGVLRVPQSGGTKLLLKFNAERKNEKQTVDATTVTVQKTSLPSGLVGVGGWTVPLPESGTHSSYANIANGYIATLTGTTSETFSGDTVDDYSRPTNNYLPKGTVDYCLPQKIYDTESGKKYYLLKSNYRVYANSSVKIQKGTLPSGNTVNFSRSGTVGKYYELAFDVDWKAPFRLRLESQKYKNTQTQDYSITGITFSYVDITFCYSNKITGQVKIADCPLFKRAKWIKNEKDYTLRLYLKKAGAFYGWTAKYNDRGQLVFSFLNPAKLQKSHSNRYGYSLKGVKIVLDAGHGGKESGTYGVSGKKYEKYYTLLYANSLKQKLLSLGATVAMTRTTDTTVSLPSRYRYIMESQANLGVSVHFNGSASSSAHGYFMGYFNPFTYKASSYLSGGVSRMNLISKYNGGLDWHYFNLSRVSACPVVLTENGYLTNPDDFGKIRNAAFRNNYTEGLAAGIVSYFAAVKSGTTGSASSIRKITPISRPSRVVSAVSSKAPSKASSAVSLPSHSASSGGGSSTGGSSGADSFESGAEGTGSSGLSESSSKEGNSSFGTAHN